MFESSSSWPVRAMAAPCFSSASCVFPGDACFFVTAVAMLPLPGDFSASVSPLPVSPPYLSTLSASVSPLPVSPPYLATLSASVSPLPLSPPYLVTLSASVSPLPLSPPYLSTLSTSLSHLLVAPTQTHWRGRSPLFLQLLVVFPLPLYIVFCDVSHHIAEVCVLPLGKCLRTQA